MGQIIPFAFEDRLVRSVERNGEPWFVGKDICGVLDISKHNQALERLDDDERGTCNVGTPSGIQEMIIVSEAGVYRLVFTSRKPEAERFKRWLAHEVLPQLRKSGVFALPPGSNETPIAPAAGEVGALGVLNWRLAAVKEARILFGPARAARMWASFGLPDVPAAPPALADSGRSCLAHLLAAETPDARPVGRLLDLALYQDDMDAGMSLVGLGVRVMIEHDPPGFVVSSGADFLKHAFKGTPWERGQWTRALRRVQSARPTGPMRFGQPTMRGTFLPAEVMDLVEA